ncbi:MAG TPA: hypothetical protein VHE80_01825 [Acidimicrobiales bacterium]|nr:hypothetical protein [Acidimicrobiales bacterium]
MTRKSRAALCLAVAAAGLTLAMAGCSFGGGIDVRGKEYGYENMPGNLAAGEHAFRFTNKGKEPHEMVVVRVNDGSTSVGEVLRLPTDEAMAKSDVVGRSFAEPDQQGTKVEAELGAGRYALVCFLPVGGTGPPHFERGMVREFTVD